MYPPCCAPVSPGARCIGTGGAPVCYRRMLYFLVLSCLPLLVVPFVQDLIKGFSTDNSIIAEGCFFLITALLLTLADKAVKGIKTCWPGSSGWRGR